MGLLDAIFAGSNGLVKTLHDTFGARAVVKMATFERYGDELTITANPEEYPVAFVMSDDLAYKRKAPIVSTRPARAPEFGVRTDLSELNEGIVGQIAACDLPCPPVPGRDLISIGGVEYLIDDVQSAYSGNDVAYYAIAGHKV